MSAPRIKRQFAGDAAQRSFASYIIPRYTGSIASSSSSSSSSGGGGGGGGGSSGSTAATCVFSSASTSPSALSSAGSSVSTCPGSPPPAPALSPSVQANLLSIGMRVRKSVPEGYKTSPGDGAFKSWTASTGFARALTIPGSVPAAATAAGRELLPFCGLHRIGGTAPQIHIREATPTADELDAVPDADDMPPLSLSQDSVAAEFRTDINWGGREGARKRRFDEGDGYGYGYGCGYGDGEHDAANGFAGRDTLAMRDADAWLDEEVSPRTVRPPPRFGAPGWPRGRVLAKPRRKTHFPSPIEAPLPVAWLDRECRMSEGFEEATFLDWGSPDVEFEMVDA